MYNLQDVWGNLECRDRIRGFLPPVMVDGVIWHLRRQHIKNLLGNIQALSKIWEKMGICFSSEEVCWWRRGSEEMKPALTQEWRAQACKGELFADHLRADPQSHGETAAIMLCGDCILAVWPRGAQKLDDWFEVLVPSGIQTFAMCRLRLLWIQKKSWEVAAETT